MSELVEQRSRRRDCQVVAGYPGTENAPAEEHRRLTKTVLKHTVARPRDRKGDREIA